MYTYLAGPRLALRKNDRLKPFTQTLAGGGRLNASSSLVSAGENSFVLAIGGGLDYTIRHRLAIRVIEADYFLTRFAHPDGSSASQNNVRISAGLIFRFGIRE
jgi:outer membrane immunogenic protein